MTVIEICSIYLKCPFYSKSSCLVPSILHKLLCFYNHRSESQSCSAVSDFLWPHRLYSPWNSLGQNTGVGSLSLLQGIFPTQGSNPDLLHRRWILYQLSHKGSPRILEWVAYPFSSRSSWPRNRTGVSCIPGGFFTDWAIRDAHNHLKFWPKHIEEMGASWICGRFRTRITFKELQWSPLADPFSAGKLWDIHSEQTLYLNVDTD